jgi:DNA N-6-adenine-methyltransferase (Dam)
MTDRQQKQKSNEWYTPSRYIEAAREVMGGIDLDPASCELANQTVKATRYYTEQENGLGKPWHGNVWLNPPYSSAGSTSGMLKVKGVGGIGKGETGFFIAKLLNEYRQGNINQAIVCINADTNRLWFQSLWPYLICFSHKKILFSRPGHEKGHHYFGTCFVYLGSHEHKFIEVFSQFGTIAKRVEVPRAQPLPSLWEVVV